MKPSARLRDLRAVIRTTLLGHAKQSSDGRIANQDVLASLHKYRAQLIKEVQGVLINMELTKLINDECKKLARPKRIEKQPDLFGKFENGCALISFRPGVKRDAFKMTIDELEGFARKVKNTRKTEKDLILEIAFSLKQKFSADGGTLLGDLIRKNSDQSPADF